MLEYFENTYKPKLIISYSNRSYPKDNIYKNLEFDFKENTEPKKFYAKRGKYYETVDIFEKGFYTLYDSGRKVYIKSYKGSRNDW